MTNYDQSELVAICYNPGIPTDQAFGNISIPEVSLRYNYVDSLEFSTYTMDFSAEQLLKKRNGDTFIDELTFIGDPNGGDYVGISKINIKLYYTPIQRNMYWKYDKSGGITIDYTGIRYKVTKYYTNGFDNSFDLIVISPEEKLNIKF